MGKNNVFIFVVFVVLFSVFCIIYYGYKENQKKLEYEGWVKVQPAWAMKKRVKACKSDFPEAECIVNHKPDNTVRVSVEPGLVIGGNEDETRERYLFHMAFNVQADQTGNFYVAQVGQGVIRKYNAHGEYLMSIGRKGNGPGEMPMVFGMELDTLSRVHVVQEVFPKHTIFSAEGEFIKSHRVEAPGSFGYYGMTESNGDWFFSYYDRKTKKTIHRFSDKGAYMNSWGSPLGLDDEGSALAYKCHKACSHGRLLILNEQIYYSQYNPYEIHVYDCNTFQLEKKIFRKNKFFPRKTYLLDQDATASLSGTSQSSLLAYYQGYIIHCIAAKRGRIPVTVIDVFSLGGRLLGSKQLEYNCYFTDLDAKGNLYGIKNNMCKYYKPLSHLQEQVVRYQLVLKVQ